MIKRLLPVLIMLPIIYFSSCKLISEDEDLSSTPSPLYFYIQDEATFSYSNIAFEYDSANNVFTNTDELFPYGSLDDTLSGYFYYEDSYGMWVKYGGYGKSTTDPDTSIYYSATYEFDHLFNGEVTVTLYSEDGHTSVPYKIRANAVQENPNELVWSEIGNQPNELTDNWYKKGYYFNGNDYVLTGVIDTENGTVKNSLYVIEDGKFESKTLNNFPEGIMHTIIPFEGVLHVYGYLGLDPATNTYVAKQEHWTSTDGTTWQQESTYPAVGEGVIFSNALVFKDKLWFYGGSKINEGQKRLDWALYNTKKSESYEFILGETSIESLMQGQLAIGDTILSRMIIDTVKVKNSEGVVTIERIDTTKLYKVKTIARAGIPEASNVLLSSTDGLNFTNEGNLPSDMPIRFAAIEDYGNIFLALGGEKADGDYSDNVWLSEDMFNFIDEESPTAAIKNGCVIYYRDLLFNFGGEYAPGSLARVLESGNGKNWYNVPRGVRDFESDYAKSSGYSAWINEDDNYINVVGSYIYNYDEVFDGLRYNNRVGVSNAFRGLFYSYAGAY